MKTQILPGDDPHTIKQAANLLKQGGLVAFPTDTVYGLGADAFNSRAIEQLYSVKARDTSKAIAILVGSVDALARVAGEMGAAAQRLAAHFWPGPLTVIVPRHPGLPNNLSPLPTIGIRMPDHPQAIALLKLAGPLAATSANLSGMPSPESAQDVLAQLEGRVALIIDGGRTPGGIPSTVVDCTGEKIIILREGPVTLQQIQMALG